MTNKKDKIMVINNDYRIKRLDKHSLALEKRITTKINNKTKEIISCDEFVILGYHGSVEDALASLCKYHLVELNDDIKSYIKELKEETLKIVNAVKNINI